MFHLLGVHTGPILPSQRSNPRTDSRDRIDLDRIKVRTDKNRHWSFTARLNWNERGEAESRPIPGRRDEGRTESAPV